MRPWLATTHFYTHRPRLRKASWVLFKALVCLKYLPVVLLSEWAFLKLSNWPGKASWVLFNL